MLTGIILAAGFSRRMKRNKLMLEIDGTPIIERVIRAVVNSKLDEILIIYRDSCVKIIADKYKITSIYNEYASSGQSESIKLGVKNSNNESEAYLFFTGDQPFITSDIINKIIQAYEDRRKDIVVPLYDGRRGNPVLFPSKYKEQLLSLEGDVGGRKIIQTEMENVYFENIEDKVAGLDIDTWEEYLNYC